MGSWQLDPYHTQVEFSAKHLGMMTVRGYFDEVSATADIELPPIGRTPDLKWPLAAGKDHVRASSSP